MPAAKNGSARLKGKGKRAAEPASAPKPAPGPHSPASALFQPTHSVGAMTRTSGGRLALRNAVHLKFTCAACMSFAALNLLLSLALELGLTYGFSWLMGNPVSAPNMLHFGPSLKALIETEVEEATEWSVNKVIS